jgi:hypothetical protein
VSLIYHVEQTTILSLCFPTIHYSHTLYGAVYSALDLWTFELPPFPEVATLALDLWTFELPPFPELATLALELWFFSGVTPLPSWLPTTGMAVASLFTNMVRLHCFMLLCYTLQLS